MADVKVKSAAVDKAKPKMVTTKKVKKASAKKEAEATKQTPKKVKAAKKTLEECKKEREARKKQRLDNKKKLAEGKLPGAPETLLKRRRFTAQLKAKKRMQGLLSHKKKLLKKRVIFKRAEQYVLEYRKQFRDEIRLRKEAKKNGNFHVPAEPKIAFVIRIRGINGISPKVRKALQLLRLRQINNAVFVKINGATVPMLRLVEPYVTWGYPNLRAIRTLVYKRGYGKVNGQRKPLISNKVIEKALGKYNILCMEDIIHELFTCGANFTRVSNFLWPFKLNTPTGGWRKKLNHYVEGGDFGCRENKINNLIAKMC